MCKVFLAREWGICCGYLHWASQLYATIGIQGIPSINVLRKNIHWHDTHCGSQSEWYLDLLAEILYLLKERR